MLSILVVDDEPLIRLLLEDVLTQGGFRVTLADDAQAAVALIAESATTLFALITDIEIGDRTSGWELARYARSLNADLHVIYISGRCADGWASQGVPDSQFVQKPFTGSKVLGALRSSSNSGSEDAA